MSYVDDFGIDDFDGSDLLSGATIDYNYVSITKETEKAYLVNFGTKGSALVPKSMIDRSENHILSIYEEFKLKYINKIKTIGIGDIC